MELHEYMEFDAVGLRALIASGEVRRDAVERVARQALESANAELNALTMPLFDEALTHDPDGVFGGVPFLIKDSGPFARGVPFTLGSNGIRGVSAQADHGLMARFRAAGLATLGQTAAPELGLNFATEPVRYGPVHNPWLPGRGAGGSSGGAAALVAAGAVPVAHANDGAGSIRVPASCCGVVGLKPSRGRTPSGPDAGETSFGNTVEFVLTRTIRDAAHLLDAVGGPDPGGKYQAPRPNRPYAAELRADPGRLRIALTVRPWSGVPVDPQVAAVTRSTAEVLEWLGHTVTEASPAIDADDVVEALMLGVYTAGAALLRAPTDRTRWEAVSRRVFAETARASAVDVVAAADAQNRVTRAIGRFFGEYDLLLTPTLAQPPAPHGTLDYDDPGPDVRGWLRRILAYGPFTAPFNVSGGPAVSLPLGWSREGLPLGIHLAAATGREDLLIAVGAQLEQAVPWHDRRPPVGAHLR